MVRVTQVEIARQVGLDVSSVNKILNNKPGPVFAEETIHRVKQVARLNGFRPFCISCRCALGRGIVSYVLPQGRRLCTPCAESIAIQFNMDVASGHATGSAILPPPCGPLPEGSVRRG